MENYKRRNQKGLPLHVEAKKKELQRRKETKKTL